MSRLCGVACALLVLVAMLATATVAGARGRRAAEASAKAPAGDRALRHRVHRPPARTAIVNGTQISIAQAPWQVAVLAEFAGESLLCGGSIIGPKEVVTAAHCVFDETTDQPIPAADFEVRAGTADLLASEPTLQERSVSSVRPHPYYNPTEPLPRADDLAVLTLSAPLTETAGSVQKLALSALGVGPPEGTAVGLTGFGEESSSPPDLNGKLNAISMTTAFPRRCGGESDALYVCASTPSGSLCSGDSGSALTTPGSPATAIGVTDTVQIIQAVACRPGAGGGFANLAAPEIADFVGGSESPPRAPRGGGD
ncbi:MAG TPA: serine protease, partial [Solirubrobacteraceae bacterium]|nr:serine protease [Solirubrobacteraceae bacterium]